VKTASNWLGEIVERANLPQLTDLGGALIVYNNLTCSGASVHTFRRFPIGYVIVGRERRYRVDDVIAYAQAARRGPAAQAAAAPQQARQRRSNPQPLTQERRHGRRRSGFRDRTCMCLGRTMQAGF
jgi:hypothetical protein